MHAQITACKYVKVCSSLQSKTWKTCQRRSLPRIKAANRWRPEVSFDRRRPNKIFQHKMISSWRIKKSLKKKSERDFFDHQFSKRSLITLENHEKSSSNLLMFGHCWLSSGWLHVRHEFILQYTSNRQGKFLIPRS